MTKSLKKSNSNKTNKNQKNIESNGFVLEQ